MRVTASPRRRWRWMACALALASAATIASAAQQSSPPVPAKQAPTSRPAATAPGAVGQQTPAAGDAKGTEPVKAPAELKTLRYRSIGPASGGRVSRVAGVPGDPRTYYAATASGGVWKSADGGTTWKPAFDDQPISSIGSIAVSPSDPNVVYVGSGEANIRGNVAAGNGIYKSTDAGRTWTHVWVQEGQIGTVAVHPANPDVAYAAVLGHAFGPNSERGVYRTTDGGKTWQQVLKKDPDTGASDVALDPSNPRIVFAGLWQARRSPWDLVSGGPGSGLYVSRDGGDTWKAIKAEGLPEGTWGKVGVAVAPSDGRRVYALIEAEAGGLFRSDDGGESWRRVSADRSLRQRAWYYSTITVDPTNADVVWFPQVPMLKTIDGGRTIRFVPGIHHGDHHDVWIDPKDPRRMIAANDGGVDVSINGGESWFAPALPIAQFYHVAADTRVPFRVSGAMQDLGTAEGPSNSLDRRGILLGDWHAVGGGEAGHTAYDPSDPEIVYAGEYLGYLSCYDSRTRQSRNVSVWPENPSGHGGEDMRYRFQWTAPIATSPHDPKTVYHGAQVIFRTDDGGQSWAVISPDLTRNDKSKQKWAGGPITGDNTGVETFGTVFAIAESPKREDLVWAGSDDGLVHVTVDGGKSWKNVTASMAGFPEWGTVSLIEPSPFDAETAYVVVDAHRLDDMRPYLFRTTDLGRTWTRLDGKLPRDVYLHAVREDPARQGLLYLGTERGVLFSTDGGTSWQPLQLNLPTVAVHDLLVKDDRLVVATHGRSIWILDDLAPVRELSAQVTASEAHLFTIPKAVEWRLHGDSYGSAAGSGRNPAAGAVIYYFLKEKPGGSATLEIVDAGGRLVRTLTDKVRPFDGSSEFEEAEAEEKPETRKPDLATDPGVHRAVWDYLWEGAEKIKGGKIDTGDPRYGPLALPGRYTVRLTVNGKSYTQSLEVSQDPRLAVPAADLADQLTLALAIRDDITKLTTMVNRLRSITTQLRQRNQALEGTPKAADLVEASEKLAVACESLEGQLHNPKAEIVYDILAQRGGTKLYSRMSPLLAWVIDGDGAPTKGMRDVYEDQAGELRRYETEYQDLVTRGLDQINTLANSLGIPHVILP